jgi:AraC family transcriptional regulator
MTLKIKNMVCDRCIKVVREELERLHLKVRSVELGTAVVERGSKPVNRDAIRQALVANGFDLLEDARVARTERIKQSVIRFVRGLDGSFDRPPKFTEALARDLNADYQSLSALFSSIENMTIEHYVILQKIERVKELLVYGELSLSEIGHRLGYSSVAHLSAQFKSVTGFTPTAFKKLKRHRRQPLDRVASPARRV